VSKVLDKINDMCILANRLITKV